MFEWFHNLFTPTENPDVTQSIVTIMLAIGGGVLFGRMKIFKISLGVVAVMFAGLVLGHYGYRIQLDILHFIRDLGLIFFVYAVGIQVGPSFFSSFKKEGLVFNALAISGILISGLVTFFLYKNTNLGIENLVGVMSGSVTNTPGLGAAKGVLQEFQSQMPEKTFADPAIAYAITYPLGVFGIIFLIVLMKKIFKIDVNQEMRKFRMLKTNSEELLVPKKCRVTQEAYFNKTIHKVIKETGNEVVITRLKHSKVEAVFSPSLDTKLQENDVLMVFGTEQNVAGFISKLGHESKDLFIETTSDIQTKNLYVTNPKVFHKKLNELDLYNKYELKVTRVFRAGSEILARPSLELFFGDKLHVVGTLEAINEVETLIGNKEKKLIEPDFLSLFGGLLIGVMLGSIPLFIPSMPVPIKLGFAAGPLIAALFISRYGGVWVVHSYINSGAITFMKDLGLTLFFVSVGVHAGEGFYENFVLYNGWLMMFYGFFILTIPVLIITLMAKFFLKINFLQLVGLISGMHTDSAALAFSTSYLDSDIPIQAYATVYPMASIARILVAQILIVLLAG